MDTPGPAPAHRIAAFGAALCIALAPMPATAADAGEPVFTAVLAWRDGRVVVDAQRSRLDLGSRAADYAACGLTPEAIRAELVGHLDALYATLGPAFERLALPPAAEASGQQERRAVEQRLRELAARDAATAALFTLSADWAAAKKAVDAWWQAHRHDEPRVAFDPGVETLYRAAGFHPGLADGPLLPAQADRDEPPEPQDFAAGRLAFQLAPPLQDVERLVRPVRNVEQWSRLRGALGEEALAGRRCRLWFREPVETAVQDYLELRGLPTQRYRAPRDAQALAARLDLPSEPPPKQNAGVAAERPRFRAPGDPPGPAEARHGGRVLILPDPRIRTVFVETGARGAQALWRALYLALPSADLRRIRSAPQRFLCRTEAVWKPQVDGQPRPAAVRLDLDGPAGRELAFAQVYMTPRELGLRLQRLAAIGYRAGISFTEDVEALRLRHAALVIEPLGAEADTSGDPLPATIAPCEAATPPAAGTAEPAPLPDPAQDEGLRRDAAQRRATAPAARRNELGFSLEKPAGKPLSAGLSYRHTGLQPGDSFMIAFGHQRTGRVEGSYARDFVAFDTLGRRLQLAARAYRTPLPERPLDGIRQDERVDGASLEATLDLWRDRHASFGQLSALLMRTQTTPEAAPAPLPAVHRAQLGVQFAQAPGASPAAPYSDLGLMVGRGRSAGAGFGLARLEAGHQRFVGLHERIDLRLRIATVGHDAPRSEWLPVGGEDSVRGWRNETALARRTTSLQSEYWMPLPWPHASESTARLLRRQFALAWFADVATASATAPASRTRYAGAGLGLRYTQAAATPALTLKLDLGRPVRLGDPLGRDERRWRLHLSVSTQLSV